MSKITPAIPKGTRDFGPEEVTRRNYIINVIRKTFENYGYKPIETPAMEMRQTLTGKYGEESDRLIFNILNSGDYLAKADGIDSSRELTPKISEKALRFDLTVPFARYVVQHRNDISFPFKRYQIQPVWRADRPQKGRYREFWQCDADVIGSDSLLNEVELFQIMGDVFEKLGIKANVEFNHRKVLAGIAEAAGVKDKFSEFTITLDKLDKIGQEGFEKELKKKGFSEEAIQKINSMLSGELSFEDSTQGAEGISDMETIKEHISNLDIKNTTGAYRLARGLDYYTGIIFEAKSGDTSIAGGGRYDNLTGIFGLEGVSGVGFSFGLDRIYNLMEEQGLFPNDLLTFSKVLLANFGSGKEALLHLKKIREAGISAEMYPDEAKLAKQMKYADVNHIPYVILMGAEEIKSGKLTLKDMQSGEQETLSVDDIIQKLS